MIFTKEMDKFVVDLLAGVAANRPYAKRSLELILAGASAPTKLKAPVTKGFQSGAKYLQDFGITTGLRLSHFLGQVSHETGGFQWMEEQGSPSYFDRYEGRTDLGNTTKGDGARYHGRGLIQLTGRNNYRLYGRVLGLPLESNPEIAKDFPVNLQVALHYWTINRLSELADEDNVSVITRRINGGQNGLQDRIRKVEATKAAIAKEYLMHNLIEGE